MGMGHGAWGHAGMAAKPFRRRGPLAGNSPIAAPTRGARRGGHLRAVLRISARLPARGQWRDGALLLRVQHLRVRYVTYDS